MAYLNDNLLPNIIFDNELDEYFLFTISDAFTNISYASRMIKMPMSH